jgi:ATP-dependent exoDNAse (exonuclease V) alpha subunit
MSIHKAQGQTYQAVRIDLENAFDDGQMYVALSRCRNPEGIYLKHPVKVSDIKVNSSVTTFLSNADITKC